MGQKQLRTTGLNPLGQLYVLSQRKTAKCSTKNDICKFVGQIDGNGVASPEIWGVPKLLGDQNV